MCSLRIGNEHIAQLLRRRDLVPLTGGVKFRVAVAPAVIFFFGDLARFQLGGNCTSCGKHSVKFRCVASFMDSPVKSVYADVRDVINQEVDDYFHIILRFYNGLTADIELGTYYLSTKPDWFERHWYVGGDKGVMELDGFHPRGNIVRTSRLLTEVGKKRATGDGGPTRSFGTPEPGLILTEPLPIANTEHADYFRNYIAAWNGEAEFLVKIDEVRRSLRLMDAVRESAETGFAVAFE